MKISPWLCLFAWLSVFSIAYGQERPEYETKRLEGKPPKLDGDLSDEVWEQVEWAEVKHQSRPNDALQASQKTRFKILYNAKNLYVAIQAFDDEPGKIEARLGRRDEFPGDYVEINFDSFNDKRTGFSFTTSASGVRGDEFISADGDNWDRSWDPYWMTKARVDSSGYTVEARIPFSQLRFGKEETLEWGLQVNRRFFRNQETDNWARIRQAQNGYVSRFGTLTGLEGIEARKPLEIQPYVVGQMNTGGKFDENDPFGRQSTTRLNAGLDGRIGITNDVAVDFTINPDFGQVEADPGAINLDGFQIFFREQRPFFVENRNIFDYNLTNSENRGGYSGDLLFYSRRIGGTPSRFIRGDPVNGRYVRQPDNTTILGAAKVSGKTQSGLSIGLLSTATEREIAEIVDLNQEDEAVVEPFTAYNVGRVQQDFNDRNSSIGVMLTSVNRNLEGNEDLSFLHNSAYAGGVDFVHRWNDRAWRIQGNFAASQVRGSAEAIKKTQTAFEHLFQRPDADYLRVDSSRTSLAGSSGTFTIGNYANEWTFEVGGTYRSPGLELNDVGFLSNTDQINAFAWGARNWRNPFSIFNSAEWSHELSSSWTYGGQSLGRRYSTDVRARFKNFMYTHLWLNLEEQDVSKNALRGGPLLRRSPGYYTGFYWRSDRRKDWSVSLSGRGGGSYDGNTRGRSVGVGIDWQILDALRFSFDPDFSWDSRNDQFISIEEDAERTEYVHGRIEQQTLQLTVRATYNLTPDFTVQYYAQPFITNGTYSNFNRVTNPDARDFDERFKSYAADQITWDEESNDYEVNDDEDGAVDYTFSDPDFNFVQFRSNLVFRWEYRPSSTLFLVWQQGVTGEADPMRSAFETLTKDLFAQEIRNTFLLKASYRWVR